DRPLHRLPADRAVPLPRLPVGPAAGGRAAAEARRLPPGRVTAGGGRMLWLFRAARRLREIGILGMNRRNAACILDHNPRALYPVVDDKLRMRDLCELIGVPTPKVYAAVRYHSELRRLPEILGDHGDFVVKPNQGSAGRGVLVVLRREGRDYVRHNGEVLKLDGLPQHLSDILSGMYSLGGRADQAIVQQRVRLHAAFTPISYKGIPDI